VNPVLTLKPSFGECGGKTRVKAFKVDNALQLKTSPFKAGMKYKS
jgi:hypothetical protein